MQPRSDPFCGVGALPPTLRTAPSRPTTGGLVPSSSCMHKRQGGSLSADRVPNDINLRYPIMRMITFLLMGHTEHVPRPSSFLLFLFPIARRVRGGHRQGQPPSRRRQTLLHHHHGRTTTPTQAGTATLMSFLTHSSHVARQHATIHGPCAAFCLVTMVTMVVMC